ncbi:MAG TPA: heme ABC exporter ATP-binding protein CcmA [bacterium]|nr:heme ABC exporter ATP-binding protein CcmA [bacterium]
MIIAQGLCKKFGSLYALRDVSFEIGQGQWVALLGANGAGKTSLSRILAALSRPSAGRACVAGQWVDEKPELVRERIGVVSHHTLLYEDLSAVENLKFYAAMYRVRQAEERMAELLNQVGLWTRRRDPVRTFSRGMQQRLALVRAMLHEPSVLLLDEPFAGLDVHASRLLTHFMEQALQQNVTVFMTTHDVEYAQAHSQRTLVLVQGRLRLNEASRQIAAGQVLDLLRDTGPVGTTPAASR